MKQSNKGCFYKENDCDVLRSQWEKKTGPFTGTLSRSESSWHAFPFSQHSFKVIGMHALFPLFVVYYINKLAIILILSHCLNCNATTTSLIFLFNIFFPFHFITYFSRLIQLSSFVSVLHCYHGRCMETDFT